MAAQDAAWMREALVAQVVGRTVQAVQVLGPNSLKTVEPLETLAGQAVVDVAVDDGVLVLHLDRSIVRIDPQRAARLVWRESLERWSVGDPTMPTVRVLLDSGGFDLTEPSKTKRIAVWVAGE